jgi:hypothetical protein
MIEMPSSLIGKVAWPKSCDWFRSISPKNGSTDFVYLRYRPVESGCDPLWYFHVPWYNHAAYCFIIHARKLDFYSQIRATISLAAIWCSETLPPPPAILPILRLHLTACGELRRLKSNILYILYWRETYDVPQCLWRATYCHHHFVSYYMHIVSHTH